MTDNAAELASEFEPELSKVLRKTLEKQARAAGESGCVVPVEVLRDTLAGMKATKDLEGPDRIKALSDAASALRTMLREPSPTKNAPKIALDPKIFAGEGAAPVDPADLEVALNELEKEQPRLARVVELRYFADLAGDQVGAFLEVSPRTVGREWRSARLWLTRRLS